MALEPSSKLPLCGAEVVVEPEQELVLDQLIPSCPLNKAKEGRSGQQMVKETRKATAPT